MITQTRDVNPGFGANDWLAGVEERGTSDEPPAVRRALSTTTLV